MMSLGHALSAYATAAAHGRPMPRPPEEAESAAPAFGTLLRAELQDAVSTLRTGEVTAVAGVLGKASVQQVVEAVSAAELSLQKVTAVRDRVISAYQEIIRMPI